MRSLATLLLSSWWLLWSIPLQAVAREVPPPQLDLELSLHQDSTPTTVGDRLGVELVLTVESSTGLLLHEAHFPEWGSHWGEAEVVAVSEVQREEEGSRTRFSQQVELMATQPGETVLSAVSARVRTERGELISKESTELAFVVHSILPARGATPPPWPSAPPRELPLPATFLPTMAAMATAVLVLLGLLWWQARRRRGNERPSAREEFTQALAKLQRGNQGTAQRHTELSLALRRYLFRRLARPALESTCSEIEGWLHSCPISPASAEEVISVLRFCDAVRFAAANRARQPSPAKVPLLASQRWVEEVERQLLQIGGSPGTGELEHGR